MVADSTTSSERVTWVFAGPRRPGFGCRVATVSVLLLADSRLPAGGHGHSGGVEALVDRGLLSTETDLAPFLSGRVRTGAACRRPRPRRPARWPRTPGADPDWDRWDAAVSARMPSAATREASRAQGAALLRTAALAWPSPALTRCAALPRSHHPLVLGAAAAAAGADPAAAAALAVHHLVGGACTAAVRLLGLDPLRVAARRGRGRAGGRAARGRRPPRWPPRRWPPTTRPCCPTDGSPLTDVLAELHHRSEATLFAS